MAGIGNMSPVPAMYTFQYDRYGKQPFRPVQETTVIRNKLFPISYNGCLVEEIPLYDEFPRGEFIQI